MIDFSLKKLMIHRIRKISNPVFFIFSLSLQWRNLGWTVSKFTCKYLTIQNWHLASDIIITYSCGKETKMGRKEWCNFNQRSLMSFSKYSIYAKRYELEQINLRIRFNKRRHCKHFCTGMNEYYKMSSDRVYLNLILVFCWLLEI